MPCAATYLQLCPTCGRRIQVRVQYLGRSVTCEHCTATFIAEVPEPAQSSGDSGILMRAEQLLASMDELRRQTIE